MKRSLRASIPTLALAAVAWSASAREALPSAIPGEATLLSNLEHLFHHPRPAPTRRTAAHAAPARASSAPSAPAPGAGTSTAASAGTGTRPVVTAPAGPTPSPTTAPTPATSPTHSTGPIQGPSTPPAVTSTPASNTTPPPNPGLVQIPESNLDLSTLAGGPTRYSYRTWGLVGASPKSPAGPIAFEGVTKGLITTPGTINLGHFVVAPLPPSGSVTLHDAPFAVDAWVNASGPLLKIRGVLNGTIHGDGTSTMVATSTSIDWSKDAPAPFPLNVQLPVTIAGPHALTGGTTNLVGITADPSAQVLSAAPASAALQAAPVPEPAALALFAALACGLGARHWRGPRRPARRGADMESLPDLSSG